MIEKVASYAMNVQEVQAYAIRIERAANKITIPQFIESKVSAPLIAAIADMETAKTKFSTKEKTQLIFYADQKQDRRLTGLKYLLKSCTYREAEEKRIAANKLILCLRKHGWNMHKLSYPEQNARMRNFFVEVDGSPELTEALSTCNATGVYAESKKENLGFNEALNIRTDKIISSSKLTAGEVAEKIDEACTNIFQYVEVMHRIAPNQEYETFIDEANLVAKYFGYRSATS